MEQGNIVQVFRFRTHTSDGTRVVVEIWEALAAGAVNAISSLVSEAYTDGKDDEYEVYTIVAGKAVGTRKLCWDTPPRCRKERLCVVLDDSLEDFRSYCTDFFS